MLRAKKLDMVFTFSEENYLKAIYHLENQHKKGVPTNALAEMMDTKASSATDMIKRLSEKELVNYRKYQGVKLTTKGENQAIKVIRKHRLWECFLVDKLNFSWDEVHDIAEQLEHIESEKLIHELDKFLGYPKTDPHGDAIPDGKGNFSKINKVLLSKCEPEQTGVFLGVKDSSASFLQYLDKKKISIGTKIKVLSKEFFDGSVMIKIEQEQFSISHKIAENLYVQIQD